MSDNIIQLNQELIHNELKNLVRNSVEETLNALLDHEAEELVNAGKYERSGDCKGYRSSHYSRNFQTTAGEVILKIPKLKGVPFETAIIERYRRRECSVEEALIETWRSRKLTSSYPYVYVYGVYLKRSWGGEIQNVSILISIGVNEDGCREIIGAAEGMKEVSMLLKAIHAQECKTSAKEKAEQAADKLRKMKLASAAKKVEDGIEETLTYMDFPSQHWTRIRTNNTIERLNREIKRRTRAIGAFPDGQSALMLVCARLRHVAGTQWGTKRYMNMEHLKELDLQNQSDIIAG